MSGLSRTPGKRVWVNPHRGFESRPLRQNAHAKSLQFSRIAGIFVLVRHYTTTFIHLLINRVREGQAETVL